MNERRVILHPGEDGYWVVECLNLHGCISQGRTKEEAVANNKEAIALYIESLEAHGDPVPEATYASLSESPLTAMAIAVFERPRQKAVSISSSANRFWSSLYLDANLSSTIAFLSISNSLYRL